MVLPTSLSLFGAAFLLGPGVRRRYFEIDGNYEIPMDEDDPSFVLGGKHPGDETPDLVLETAAPLATRQAELFRRGDDLYVRDLATEPVNWIGHEREWSRLKDGQSRRLSPGDRLVLGVNANIASVQEVSDVADHAVLWINFGDGRSSFRLSPLGPNQSPFISAYASLDPVFRESPKRLYHPNGAFRGYQKPYRLPLEERFWLWRSWGLTRMERLLDLSTRFRRELSDGARRKLLEEAIEIGERRGGAAKLSLAKASLYAGDYWKEKRNFDLAEQYLERGRSLLEVEKSDQKSASDLWATFGVRLYYMHESALWWARSRSRSADEARHYEGMAKYVMYVLPPDPDAESIDDTRLTRREYLERAATAFQTAGPNHREDWERIQGQIQREFNEGPFR